jgi:hypothetical protein
MQREKKAMSIQSIDISMNAWQKPDWVVIQELTFPASSSNL